MYRSVSSFFGRTLFMATGVTLSKNVKNVDPLYYDATHVEKEKRKKIWDRTEKLTNIKNSPIAESAEPETKDHSPKKNKKEEETGQLKRACSVDDPLQIQFRGKSRDFNLALLPIAANSPPFARDLTVTVDGEPQPMIRPHHFLYEGYVQGDPSSSVYGTLFDGVFDGNIHLSNGSLYTVEKTSKFYNADLDLYSIVLYHSGIRHDRRANRNRKSESKPDNSEEKKDENNTTEETEEHDEGEQLVSELVDYLDLRTHEEDDPEMLMRTKTCTLHLRADSKLYQSILSKEGNNDPERTLEEIISLFYTHMRTVNDIFESTTYEEIGPVNFIVKQISIDTGKGIPDDQVESTEPADISEFLKNHNKGDHSQFCLSYVFTYTDFGDEDLGMADKAYSYIGDQGGLCSSFMPFNTEGRWSNHTENAGVITLNSEGHRLSSRATQLTFAHELGHSVGAPHDDEKKKRTNEFLMAPFASVLREYPNSAKFSKHSREYIAYVVHALQRYEPFSPTGDRDYGAKRNCLQITRIAIVTTLLKFQSS